MPDYVAGLATPDPTETTVKGYKVRVSRTLVSPEEARERRDTLARVVARSLNQQTE